MDSTLVRRRKATLIGATAILMWSTLAAMTAYVAAIPPFQLTAMALTIASVMVMGKWAATGESVRRFMAFPWSVYAIGVMGIFGFHFFYFMGFRLAPAVEANLIVYFWPLLIVVMSALLPGERLRWWHGAGTAMAIAGTILLVTSGGESAGFQWAYALGYASAFGAALCWSTYSILSRRMEDVPTDVVGVFCMYSAILAWAAHHFLESWVQPVGGQWWAILAMGLGPIGAAFFVWDHGVKRGNVRTLGTAAYGTPLLSTLLLIVFGLADATYAIAVACLLIVGGACIGGLDTLAPNWTARHARHRS
jgi:drug/metabolite transporter (DMT)-like permease